MWTCNLFLPIGIIAYAVWNCNIQNRELEELCAAVQAQGKILDSISRRLTGSTMIGIGSRNEQDMYKLEIVKMVESMQDRDVLCKIYTDKNTKIVKHFLAFHEMQGNFL